MFLSLKSPIDPGNSEKTWMSLKCTSIWMERGLININGRALFALKTCHLAFMSTDKGRTAPILRRMRESFMKVRLLCHIYLLSSSTRHAICVVFIFYIFIGPESDHCLPLSLTDWLTHWLTDSCLVNLIDVTLACKDDNSNLLRLLLLLMLMMRIVLTTVWCRFGHIVKFLFTFITRFQGLVKILKLKFCHY